MGILRAGVVAALLAWGAPAFAEDYFLETPSLATRDEAVGVQKSASEQGYSARVVRRYNPGVGWEYVVRVEGFPNADVAVKAAGDLGQKTGRSLSLFVSDGDQVQAMAMPAKPKDKPKDGKTPKDAKVPKDTPLVPAPAIGDAEVAALVERARAAMGGSKAGIAALDGSRAALFSYRRIVPDGPVVKQTWARRGEDRYLDVQIERGEGRSSRTVIVGDKAWLSVKGAPDETEEAGRAREVLDRFAPDNVLAFPLGIAQALAERPELRQLTAAGTQEVGGAPCTVLRYAGDKLSKPVVLYVDDKTALVRKVVFASDAGDLVHEFSDYRTVDGIVLPHRVRTWRADQQVDDVEVLDFDLDPKLPDTWFAPPATRAP